MELEEVSLEQFRSFALEALQWNAADKQLAVAGDAAVYMVDLELDGSKRSQQLALPQRIRCLRWSPGPVPLELSTGPKRRMVLAVLLDNDTVQLWAEVAPSILRRWACVASLALGPAGASAMEWAPDGRLHVGTARGRIHLLGLQEMRLAALGTLDVCAGEAISRLAVSGSQIAVSHGIGSISLFDCAAGALRPLLNDPYIGCTCLQWLGDGRLAAVKFNQLYVFRGAALASQAELPAGGFCGAALDPSGRCLWAAGFDGALCCYAFADGSVRTTQLQLDDSSASLAAIQVSHSGRTLALLSRAQDGTAKILLGPSGTNAGAPVDARCDTDVWEAQRYALATSDPAVRYKLAVLARTGAADDAHTAHLQAVCDAAAVRLADDPALAARWAAYRAHLGASGWAGLKAMQPEACPDCAAARVLFEAFGTARCQAGHQLARCSGTFACLGTGTPFEECEDCRRRYLPNVCDTCYYCHGRVLFCP